ncbi:MAG: transcriptional regulator, TetR family protein [Rhodospirillales bacterium]|jgi:AcrR family transcriptional regulator|nr:transcriptional regulator, TetR family protein [Rhodospirillales bacterium]
MTDAPFQDETRHAVYAAAMRLAAEQGWLRTTMGEIAAAAGRDLASLHEIAIDKAAILTGITEEADRAVLRASTGLTLDDPPRERLFDVLMQRFDSLRPYRAGLRAVLRDFGGDPIAAAALIGALGRSMAWMLEAAKAPAIGPLAPLRIAALGALYARSFRTWLSDEGEDSPRTMAALDQNLRRAERWLGLT